MPKVVFTANLARHVACPTMQASGKTVREVLDHALNVHVRLRPYVLDDQAALRKHMMVYVNGHPVIDRVSLSDPVPDNGEVYVMQALSGG